jgi:uncharacterized protein (TIGR03437 family)
MGTSGLMSGAGKRGGTSVSALALGLDSTFKGQLQTTPMSFSATPGAYLTSGNGYIARFTPGSSTVSAFSYLPNPPIGTDSLVVPSQSQTAYALFNLPSRDSELLELTLPGFASASPTPSSIIPAADGFFAAGLAVASKSAIWVIGTCLTCPSVISNDAFQNTYANPSSNAVVLQFADANPTISIVTNSATGSSPFASGQLISLYGSQLGPPMGSGPQIGANGSVTTSNNGTKVLFDGTPAPVLFASSTQVNAAIPCSVAGHTSTQVIVSYLGALSPPVRLLLSPAAPGIFTVSGTGTGQAAVLNSDGSLNGPSNPAARGSEIVLYATGLGPTSPCVDGQVYASGYPTLTLPIVVGIANIGAQVVYAGQAPYLVSGVGQVNVIVPSDSPAGVVPLNMEVGGVFSPAGVTIAVK